MKSNLSAILNATTPVLVDFYADWCQPCKILAPTLTALKADLGETLKIVKIDVDKNPAISGKFNVKGVPTLILFKNKKPVWRQSGLLQKEDLLSALQPYL